MALFIKKMEYEVQSIFNFVRISLQKNQSNADLHNVFKLIKNKIVNSVAGIVGFFKFLKF